jgi:tryptophan 2,3-dioxygenase
MEITKDIEDRLTQLNEKYSVTGQDMKSYLDGLLYTDYLKYWDYIHVDTLLSLQNPKTNMPDEKVFIMYHQITELFFQLCINELKQIVEPQSITIDFFKEKVRRVVRYFDGLVTTYQIMVDGMEKEQFLKFRMALLPASGFQSAQYRMIEIYCTDLINLVKAEYAETHPEIKKMNRDELFEHIYWKTGATELATGKKTLTLIQFEEKYAKSFMYLIKECEGKNVFAQYNKLPETEKKNPELIELLRALDANTNINWCSMHYKSAVRYLQGDPDIIAATGGTNWQKYLPPRFQRISFFPTLWTDEERKDWGKAFVNINKG